MNPEVPWQRVGGPQPLARHHDGAAAAGGGLQRDGDQPGDQSEVSTGSRDRSPPITAHLAGEATSVTPPSSARAGLTSHAVTRSRSSSCHRSLEYNYWIINFLPMRGITIFPDLAATLTVTQTTLVAALSHSSRMLGLSSSRNTSPCRVPAG